MNTNDFVTGIQASGLTEITGAQLEQLVNSAYPSSDRGLVLFTTDVGATPVVPDPADDTDFKRYLWVRQSASSVAVYAWNDEAAEDNTYLKWQSINVSGIGAGAIDTTMLKDNSVTDAKIVGVSGSKITGALSASASTGLITTDTTLVGDVGGTPLVNTIGAGKVTSTKILDGAVATAKIADKAVTAAKLYGTGVAKQMTRVTVADTSVCEAFSPSDIVHDSNVNLTGNGSKLVAVNAGATAYEAVAKTTVGRVLQRVVTESSTPDTTALTCAITALPTTSNTKKAFDATAFTPLSADSTIEVEVVLYLSNDNSGAPKIAALLKDVDTDAIAAVSNGTNPADVTSPVLLKYKVASWGVSSRTFRAYYAAPSGNTRLNSTNGSTKPFGGTLGVTSSITITEYI